MKKTLPHRNSMNRQKTLKWLLHCCFIFSFFIPARAFPFFDLDTQFELGSIGVLRSSDNMDGLFNEYVSAAYKDYFTHQTRFTLNDLSSADGALDRSNIPYDKLIMDRDVLAQLAKSSRSQSILRTQVLKEGRKYHFILDWLHAPRMELLGQFEFTIDDPSGGKSLVVESLNTTLKQSLDKLFGKIPFQGNVTGRDGNSITINLGTISGLKRGDILTIGTLDEVKQHPLLKKIVEWKFTQTGKIEVGQAEEALSFCKILEEEPGKDIARSQKIFHIQKPSPLEQLNAISEPSDKPASSGVPEVPQVGNLSLSLFPAFYDRQYSDLSGISNTGGATAYSASASGEVLLTREWFAGLDFKFSLSTFGQKDILTGIDSPATAIGGVSQTDFTYKLTLGYMYLLTGNLFGPKGWLKCGFKSDSYNTPTTLGEFTGPVTFNSVFFGAGADLPLRNNWGAIANLSFRLTTSVTQDFVAEPVTGSSDVEFFLGGYYRLNLNSTLKLGIDVVSSGATFNGGTSLNQKTVSIVPSLLYYF
ncbi:MAG: hypothetical protein ABIQ95_12125 [Bdellovibrionia bacterium]